MGMVGRFVLCIGYCFQFIMLEWLPASVEPLPRTQCEYSTIRTISYPVQKPYPLRTHDPEPFRDILARYSKTVELTPLNYSQRLAPMRLEIRVSTVSTVEFLPLSIGWTVESLPLSMSLELEPWLLYRIFRMGELDLSVNRLCRKRRTWNCRIQRPSWNHTDRTLEIGPPKSNKCFNCWK